MKEQIPELIKLNIEELFKLLGKEIQATRLDLRDTEEPEETGRNAFAKYSTLLNQKICANKKILSLIESPENFDQIQIAAAILDAITGYFTGITLTTVSVLIAQKGLTNYCSKKEE